MSMTNNVIVGSYEPYGVEPQKSDKNLHSLVVLQTNYKECGSI